MKGSGKLSELLGAAGQWRPGVADAVAIEARVLALLRAGYEGGLWGERAPGVGGELVRIVSAEALDGTELVAFAASGEPAARAVVTPAPATPGAPVAVWLEGDEPRALLGGAPAEVLVVDPAAYRDRVRALPGAEAVVGAKVAVIGLGSVGSRIATDLVRLGVEVVGYDPDRLSTENLIRWGLPASLADVGRTKAEVLEHMLCDSVPGARVQGAALDVVGAGARFERSLRAAAPSLLIAATDTQASRAVVNAAAARHELPALYVTLSAGAASVRVEVVEDARRGPCHLCSRSAEDGFAAVSAGPDRAPYATDVEQAGVPALPVNVAAGSAFATRVALALLAGEDWRLLLRHGEQRGSVAFIALEPDWWVFDAPFDRLVYQPERVPGCPVCGTASAREVG